MDLPVYQNFASKSFKTIIKLSCLNFFKCGLFQTGKKVDIKRYFLIKLEINFYEMYCRIFSAQQKKKERERESNTFRAMIPLNIFHKNFENKKPHSLFNLK